VSGVAPLRALAERARAKGLFGPLFHGTDRRLPPPEGLDRPLWLSPDVADDEGWLLGANMYTGGGRRGGPAKASSRGAALWPFFSALPSRDVPLSLLEPPPPGDELGWLELLGVRQPLRFADRVYDRSRADWERQYAKWREQSPNIFNDDDIGRRVPRPWGFSMHSGPSGWDDEGWRPLYEFLDNPAFVDELVGEAGPAPLRFGHPSPRVRYSPRGKRSFADGAVGSTAVFAPRPAETLLGPYDFRKGGQVRWRSRSGR